MSIESKKLQAVCSYLSSSGIDYVLVGEDTRKLMESIESDVDFVFSRTSINRIHSIISGLCDRLDLKCVQILQHEQRAFYFVVCWQEAESWHYLSIV